MTGADESGSTWPWVGAHVAYTDAAGNQGLGIIYKVFSGTLVSLTHHTDAGPQPRRRVGYSREGGYDTWRWPSEAPATADPPWTLPSRRQPWHGDDDA